MFCIVTALIIVVSVIAFVFLLIKEITSAPVKFARYLYSEFGVKFVAITFKNCTKAYVLKKDTGGVYVVFQREKHYIKTGLYCCFIAGEIVVTPVGYTDGLLRSYIYA